MNTPFIVTPLGGGGGRTSSRDWGWGFYFILIWSRCQILCLAQVWEQFILVIFYIQYYLWTSANSLLILYRKFSDTKVDFNFFGKIINLRFHLTFIFVFCWRNFFNFLWIHLVENSFISLVWTSRIHLLRDNPTSCGCILLRILSSLLFGHLGFISCGIILRLVDASCWEFFHLSCLDI